MFIGLALVVVGIIFLLENLGYFSGDVWSYVWPVLIIVLGITMLFKPKKNCWYCGTGKKEEKTEK